MKLTEDIISKLPIIDNMDDKRLCIECIKAINGINFTESIDGENTIGYITDNDRRIKVLYLEDTIGKYIALAFPSAKKDNYEAALELLSRWIINGRHEVCDDAIILSSIFPILDTQFLYKQINHALLEIWDMNNIIKKRTRIGCVSFI